ncbi:ABC transporter permease [Dactylosporangium vinaceum]|uniref:FtsX-like permease family protein n=1 Tax=Dactylosporangium vinaceum TaxID=53362 RepID=A0ABV5MGG0_9ACTN|nr:FtsX-like permease family protein [Dactylosporangium vinaceum]UAB99042.1 ABC transporter permease [Dactylosporangium vinaceum]
MISLLLSMLRARRGQAVVLALLAMFAVAAAVAAPAYLQAVDRSIIAGQAETAAARERSLTISAVVDPRKEGELNFGDVARGVVDLPGFDQVFSGEFPAVGIEPDRVRATRVTYRQDACAHLTVVAGRCLVGSGDVVLGEAAAARLHLAPGDAITLTFATLGGSNSNPTYAPAGAPARLTVVGTYRPADSVETYWGDHAYFAPDSAGRPGEPAFISAATFAAIDHGATNVAVDLTAGPAALSAAALPDTRRRLTELRGRTRNLGSGIVITTGLPNLFERIDASQDLARRSVPAGAAPLLLLAYAVLFIAADYATQGRRPELAVVALRGTRWWTRWWLTLGEGLAALLIGGLAGCVAGQLLVAAVVAWRFPGVGAPVFTLEALRYAPVALLIAVASALVAQRRHLTAPVAGLLRRIRGRGTGWRARAGEAVVAVLAAAATLQLFLAGGSLTGVAVAAPALVIFALALGTARAVTPLARLVGAWALRRGRLATGLAALQLARRPGAQRLILLLVAAVAVLGYAVTATDLAARDRDLAAQIATGAPRVLTVTDMDRDQLLRAVRAADPDGKYAMAVVADLPRGRPGEAPRLAVDSTRLAVVPTWLDAYGDPDPAALAARLRPPVRDVGVDLPGRDLAVDATVTGARPDNPIGLTLVFSTKTGRAVADLGVVHNGTGTYSQRVADCAEGCRLVAVHLRNADPTASATRITIVLNAVRTINPPATAAAGAQLAGADRWRASGATLSAAPDGLRITVDAPDGLPNGVWVQPADVPLPLPVATTAPDATISGFDGLDVPVTTAAHLKAVPRLGTAGTLVDLEYAERLATDSGIARAPEVWLGPAAPPDALNRLAAQGLVVVGDSGIADTRARLATQGPALSLWFHVLAGALAVLLAAGGLALVIAVDRRDRRADLAVLRAQGLSRRTAGRVALWTYPALVLASAPPGLATALIAWRLTGWALPVFGEPMPDLPLPHWPTGPAVPLSWLLTLALLVTVAASTARATTTPPRTAHPTAP